MIRIKILIVFWTALVASVLPAQKIGMDFPHFAGKTYDFIIFQGDKQEKVVQGTIPEDGKFILEIPKEYAPYTGMSRWLITNSEKGGGLDMVIPGKNFSVSCQEDKPDNSNIIYRGNPEINKLNEFNKKQQSIVLKFATMQQAIKSFSKVDKIYPVFEKEYKDQAQTYQDFQNDLKRNNDYVSQLLPIINITQGLGTEVFDNEEKRAQNIAQYIANDMNWEALYTSGHWTTVISSWVDIHTQVLKDNYGFVNDFAKISSKLKDKKLYIDFAGRVSYFLSKLGKDNLINAIAPYVLSSERITNYEGALAAYTKAAPGTLGSDLIFTEHMGSVSDHNHKAIIRKSSELAGKEYRQTLLIFYESGCGPCENLLHQLPGNYENMRSKGVQIISISADKNEEVFKNTSKDFLWKESHCDYEGIGGINFKNYGVAGTPTLILIAGDGNILLKTSSLEEVLDKIN